MFVPAGMLAFCSIDAAWDFATSGLETGLIFCWEGVSFWLLARLHAHRGRPWAVAAVIGLGVLVRPDMGLIAVCLLAAATVLSTESRSWRPMALTSVKLAGAAFAVPAAYEAFRMAYFGLLVPNTALAKSAGSTWYSQGLIYLHDTFNAYWLWVPFVLALVVVSFRLRRLRASNQGRLAVVIAAPVIGGLADMFYVVRIGGDFMHARMLLPGLFAVFMAFYLTLHSRRSVVTAAVAVTWSAVAIAGLHYPQRNSIVDGIANERAFYIAVSGNPHPVTTGRVRTQQLRPGRPDGTR